MLAIFFLFPSNLSLKHVCDDVCIFLNSKAELFPNQEWYEMTLVLN